MVYRTPTFQEQPKMSLAEAKEVLSKSLGQSVRTKALVALYESNGKNGCVVLPSRRQQAQYFKALLAALNNEVNEVLARCEGCLNLETASSYTLVDIVDCYTVLRGPRKPFWRKTFGEMAWSYPSPAQGFDYLCRYNNYIWSIQSPREMPHHYGRFLERVLQSEVEKQNS